MAVDTKAKRFSMLNFGDGNHWHTTIVADGTIVAADRSFFLDLYATALAGVLRATIENPGGTLRATMYGATDITTRYGGTMLVTRYGGTAIERQS